MTPALLAARCPSLSPVLVWKTAWPMTDMTSAGTISRHTAAAMQNQVRIASHDP